MADGVDAVIHAVRQVIASGADWVKIYGSTGGFDDVTEFQTFTFEEMKAAVDATHALGKKIAIHSYGPAGARDAVRAGADSLEYANMDDQTIAEMVKRKTYYVPTIADPPGSLPAAPR
jgi:imidazolonepropionase-like amidohydrolase